MRADTKSPAQYLTLYAGEELLAIDIQWVRELIQNTSITVVPMAPEFVRGVINLRGTIVPVIDLQLRLTGTKTLTKKKTCVVILQSQTAETSGTDFGLLVDSVSEVVQIGEESLEPAPTFGTPIKRQYIKGLGRVKGEHIMIVDPEKTFNLEDMVLEI